MKKFDSTKFKQRLKECDLSYTQVASGAGVNINWLKAVLQDRFQDPNHVWIEKIERFLNDWDAIRQ